MHTISIYAVGSVCYWGVRTMHSPNCQFSFLLHVNTTVCKNVTLHHSPLERYSHEPRQPMCALEWPHSGGLLKHLWSHSTRLKLNTVLSAILLVGSRVLIKLCMPVSCVPPPYWLCSCLLQCRPSWQCRALKMHRSSPWSFPRAPLTSFMPKWAWCSEMQPESIYPDRRSFFAGSAVRNWNFGCTSWRSQSSLKCSLGIVECTLSIFKAKN